VVTGIWGLLAAIALLWPDRLSGPLDGIPLDRWPEAVAIGVLFPALCVFHPRFLATRLARASIGALLVWRVCAALLFVQDGWCLRFEPSRPYVKDATGAPHAWDLRADWRAPDPLCSAIMTRSYADAREFPAWFFNLPPASDSWPQPEDLPPEATIGLRVRGYLSTTDTGTFDIDLGPGLKTTVAVDGRLSTLPLQLDSGVHQVAIDGVMTGTQWRMIPRWNGAELWSQVSATVNRPSIGSLRIRAWARWIPFIVTALFLLGWIASALARVGDVPILAWTIGASLVIGWLVWIDQIAAARWMIVALSGAAFVRVPPRLRNIAGAFLLIGVPWLTFVVVAAAPAVGRWVLYQYGHDYWIFQRYAYRIVMQGYWLEGGSPTFYFQPLYRWLPGLLHVVFGDSSVGEWYFDGACLLAGSLFSFRIARSVAGFRWALIAAVAPLAVFGLSTARNLIGRGLSEIAATGLLSAAALCAIDSRHRRTVAVVAAGVLATLTFYTRMNHLPVAFGVALFALPLRMPTSALPRPQWWWRRAAWRTAIGVPAIIGIGLLCFAWRTWYYTGVFGLFEGTLRNKLAIWQPGMALGTVAYRMGESVLLVLTVNDPPRFDLYALPVLIGAAVSVLAVLGVPRLRDLPAAAVLFFFVGISSALIVRGSAYPGRFSVHILPITCALAVSGVAAALGRARRAARARLASFVSDPSGLKPRLAEPLR
jgi:hypothetical protein